MVTSPPGHGTFIQSIPNADRYDISKVGRFPFQQALREAYG